MQKIIWHNEKRKIKDLIPYKGNPRQISKDQLRQLKRSIEKFDYVETVAIQPDNQIVAGHMRVKAMIQLGWKNQEIDVRVPSRQLTEEEMREYLIRSNKNTGSWDYETLANEWNIDDLFQWGFEESELLDHFPDFRQKNEVEEDAGILEPGKDEDAITKIGDVFDLGCHRLVCGDSTNSDVVDSCLVDAKPILMATDPPYGVNHDPSWRDKYCIGKRGFSDKHANSKGLVKNDDQVDWSEAWNLFPGSIAYVWHAGRFASQVQDSLNLEGFEIVSQIIWAKQHFSFGRGDYHWQHEPCWYAIRKGFNHNWQGSRDQSTLWEIESLNPIGQTGSEKEEKTGHSTQKPIECMARPIRNNTAEGESVYDPFLGSGTTLIAAEQLNRICYGIEISPTYCDIIIKRWINYRKKCGKDFIVKKNGSITEEYNV